jgi:hypothetical protein
MNFLFHKLPKVNVEWGASGWPFGLSLSLSPPLSKDVLSENERISIKFGTDVYIKICRAKLIFGRNRSIVASVSAGPNSRAVWGMYCLDPGFEYRSRHGCVSAFFFVVLSCVGRGLASGRYPVQGVLPTGQ